MRTKLDISIFIDFLFSIFYAFPQGVFYIFILKLFHLGFVLYDYLFISHCVLYLLNDECLYYCLFLIACCIYLMTNAYTIVMYGLVYIIIVKLSVISIWSVCRNFIYLYSVLKNLWTVNIFCIRYCHDNRISIQLTSLPS